MKEAIRKIRASLTHNVAIKVVAVIVATLIWLIVINITDPEKTIVIYNIPVKVTHEDVIKDMDMVYEVTSNKYINITVSGKRSLVAKLSVDDFVATASLKELSKVNSIPIEVSVKQGSMARKITIEKQSVQTLQIEVEEIKKQTFDIEVEYSGNVATGYFPSNYSLSKNTVAITAPTSILKNIDRVVAQCELEGNSVDFTDKCKLALYDSDGNVIKSKHINMSSRNVSVTVEIDKEKEVPIEIGNIGTPAEGYEVLTTTLSQDKVKITGERTLLDEIESIHIDNEIDISKSKSKYSKTIDLTKYIPEGVTINGETLLQVDIEISPISSKTLTIKASDIKILNKGGNKVEVLKDLRITVQGEKKVISEITAKDISVIVDVNKLTVGKHTIPVEIKVPDSATVTKDVNAQVSIN